MYRDIADCSKPTCEGCELKNSNRPLPELDEIDCSTCRVPELNRDCVACKDID